MRLVQGTRSSWVTAQGSPALSPSFSVWPGGLAAATVPVLVFVLVLGLAVHGPANAQDASAERTEVAAEPQPQLGPEAEQMAETTRWSVRATADWLARGVDSWFADDPGRGQAKVRSGELRLRLFKRQDQSFDHDLRFDARFDLPNASRSTYLYFGRDDERDVVTDLPTGVQIQQPLRSRGAGEPGTFFAGLGRLISDEVDLRAGFRGGLNAYVQARYRKPWRLGEATRAEFRESLFYSADDGLGSTTAFAVDHPLSAERRLRWVSAATITQETRRLEWYSNLGVTQAFGHQRQLSLELLTQDAEGTGAGFTDVGLQLRWEQPVHRDWLIGEVLIGHFWPRPDNRLPRGRAWGMGVGLRLSI